MDEGSLQFPDVPRSELETTIGELVERARRVLTAQGRLRSLLNANHLVVEDLDLDHVLRHIAEAAVTLVNAKYGALGVIDSGGTLERFIHVGIPDDLVAQIGHLPEGHGILGAVIDSADPIRLEDLGADPRSIGFPAHHPPMRAFLGVPIRVRGESYGTLYLTKGEAESFTSEDEELVMAFASTAAIAIDNARLYRESQRTQRLSSALGEVTAALLASEGSDVFGVVAERVASIVDAELVAVVVPGAGDGQFRVDTARGVGAAAIEGTSLAVEEPLVARIVASGHSILSHTTETSPFGDQLAGGSTIVVPLIVSGRSVGALCVTRGAGGVPFSAMDLDTVSEFAAQAGLAVALAWARADRQRLEVVEDRARIARDLHDNVIQRLFSTGLGLQALAIADPPHAAVVETHVAEIDAAIADIRTAIFTLQTRATTETVRHRLLDVVAELTPALVSPPRMTFVGPVDLVVVDVLSDDIVSVVRESLTNVARHAHAVTTTVDVTVTDSDITVTVDDDGIGMTSATDRASGIVNLDVRARSHGGRFVVRTRKSGGTRARWQIPLPPMTGATS